CVAPVTPPGGVVGGAPFAFRRTAEVDARRVVREVVVDDRVTDGVPALTDQPREDLPGTSWVVDPRRRIQTEHGEDAIARPRPPVHVGLIADAAPSLDAGVRDLDPG